ncbi:hypothetical protein [Aureimonas sp. Leaf324]|jgi:hypothetical protein|uniref:hypothetical protein n=1 Tax=Aureimonas sp. Leaf324 TaxID=1736336 RepID=UPI0006FB48CD|nr:hypothetical protein [Aureimonas sp. Leaf324]KQQ90254.1 hypothetical protein ASF65_15490 [Aureimonas sp. Leaf324]
MSIAFFEDPENRVILQICRSAPGYIPVVIGGTLHPVREASTDTHRVSSDLSVEDYVIGLEVLGCKVTHGENDDTIVREPTLFRSDAWQARARQIQAILFVHHRERLRPALSDYLRGRKRTAG